MAAVEVWLKALSELATILGVAAAVLLYGFSVLFQKTYQRLTLEVSAKRLGGADLVEVECEVRNEAEVRVNLMGAWFALWDIESGNAGDLPLVPYPTNMSKEPVPSPHTGWSSVDAKSVVRLRALTKVAREKNVVGLMTVVRLEMTGVEKYVVRRTVCLDDGPAKAGQSAIGER